MKKSIIATALALVMSLSFLTGCSGSPSSSQTPAGQISQKQSADGGVLLIKVNPEIAVEYNKEGIVTGVTARNDDALAIISACTNLIGSPANRAVKSLVEAIGRAGYFVDDVEGGKKQITIEIEKGSAVPDKAFLDSVVNDVRSTVNRNNWAVPTEVLGETDYGLTDYVDTDYGPENDGFTDYDDTDYGPNNDGVTDYNDTDYGPNNDGVTDYDDTDYGPNNDGVTDYDDTDYGPNNDGVTDYNDTDYGPNNDGVTDYSNNSNYGNSDYSDSDDGNSNYDD